MHHMYSRTASRAIIIAMIVTSLVCATASLAQGSDGYAVYYVTPAGVDAGMTPEYDSIQDAVNAADNAVDVVKVMGGTYRGIGTLGGSQQVVYIDKSITVLGGYARDEWDTADPVANPTLINAQGLGRAVLVDGAQVTLSGLEFTSGDATSQGGYPSGAAGVENDAGGAILVSSGALTLTHSSLYGSIASASNSMPGYGGALFAYGSTLYVADCDFTGNIGGALYDGEGGAFGCDESDVTFERCRFAENSATAMPTAIGAGGAMTLIGSTVLIEDSAFDRNVGSVIGEGRGGAIYSSQTTLTISKSEMTDNKAGSVPVENITYGGGLYAKNGHVTLTDNVFSGNKANASDAGGYGLGGGAYVQSVFLNKWFNATDNVFENNVASESGQVSAGGGGYGGGLCLRGMMANVDDNTFRNNTGGAMEGVGGGLFLGPDNYDVTSFVTITNNVFVGNTASFTGTGIGGGVFMGVMPPAGAPLGDIARSVMFRDNQVLDNVAAENGIAAGGGIYLGAGTNNVTVDSNLIQGNVASRNSEAHGGGLFSTASATTVTGNSVIDNVASQGATGYGGGLGFNQAVVAVTGNVIRGNIASEEGEGFGGGIEINSTSEEETQRSRGTVNGNTIVGNTASLSWNGTGGGIYAYRSTPLSFWNNIIGGNHASVAGSGAWIGGVNGEATMTHSTFAYNTGVGQGLYGDLDYRINITNTIFAGHSLAVWGEGANKIKIWYPLWYDNDEERGGSAVTDHYEDVRGDPAFVSVADNDFHIGEGSAAIDEGLDLGLLTDVDDEERPNGQAPDIGADEYYLKEVTYLYVYVPMVLKP